jgi:gliding motility-associated lipoprotein GldJ
MGKVQDDVMHDWNNTPHSNMFNPFIWMKLRLLILCRVFRLLKNVFPPSEESYKYIYEGASPDTLVWRNRLGYNETMTNNYLRHPAYASYPVWCKLDSSCRV